MTLVPKPLYEVWTADALVPPETPDAWTFQPHLKCFGLIEGLAPTIDQATLVWDYGDMARTDYDDGEPEQLMAYVEQAELVGKFVRIVVPSKGVDWYGRIRDDGVSDLAQETYGEELYRIFGGSQFFTAYDLKYALARTIICGASSRQVDRNSRPIGYNCGGGDGRSTDAEKKGNRSVSGTASGHPIFIDSTLYAFSFDDDAVDWTAWDEVVHLLAEQCPRDQDDEPAPCKFCISDESKPFLDWYKPIVKVEGRSLLDVLNDVIDLRRGLVWRLEVRVALDDEEIMEAVIHVTSIAPASVPLPDAASLPASTTQVAIDDPNALDLSEPIQYARNNINRWHRVRVRGARRTTTFSAVGAGAVGGLTGYTFPIAIESRINKTWSVDDEEAYWQGVRPTLEPDEQTAYDDLADEEKGEQKQADRNDRFRQKKQFERVYQFFSVDAISAAGLELSPVLQQETGSVVGDVPMERRTMRLLNTTHMLVSYGYQDASDPEQRGDEEYGTELVKPFALMHLPSGAQFIPTTLGEPVDGGELDDSSTDGGWRFMDKLHATTERGWDVSEGDVDSSYERRFRTNFSMKILSGEPGFAMRASHGSAHALCGIADAAEFDAIAPSRHPKEFYWQCQLITAATEWDAYCEAVWPVAVPEESPIEELLIDIGERARYDYLAKGTVYDVDAKGHLLQVEQGGPLRDDRKLCESIARIAYLWYGPERSEATFAFHLIQRPWELGTLITTIGLGDAMRTVNAVVSQISHNLEQGGTRVTCNFPEVDFESFA